MQQPKHAMADETGRILQIIESPYLYVPCGDISDETHYVETSTREVKPKKALQMHQGFDGLSVTLMGLPSGLTVETNCIEAVTDDKPLVITYDVPGVYQIALKGHAEYLDETLEVTVGDA